MDTIYSIKDISSKPKALDKNGIYITAKVNKSETIIAPHKNLF